MYRTTFIWVSLGTRRYSFHFMYNWYQFITRSFIHTRVWFYVQFVHSTSPWESRPLLTWRPPAVTRVVLFSPRLLVNCPLVPHCSPLSPASLPPGFPRNPNVLLIRTHPNPSPNVANSPPWDASITAIYLHVFTAWWFWRRLLNCPLLQTSLPCLWEPLVPRCCCYHSATTSTSSWGPPCLGPSSWASLSPAPGPPRPPSSRLLGLLLLPSPNPPS